MATQEPKLHTQFPESTETALCVLPPGELCPPAELLQWLDDSKRGTWSPPVDIMYPFVRLADLEQAVVRVMAVISDQYRDKCMDVELDAPDVPRHHSPTTLHHRDLAQSAALRQNNQTSSPLFSLAQAAHKQDDAFLSVLARLRLPTPLSWTLLRIVVLMQDDTTALHIGQGGRMQIWGYIHLDSSSTMRPRKLQRTVRLFKRDMIGEARTTLN
ncbi:uncharacterized protein F5Z01DRAFT_251779 [Emericellopsis atlantica]|uniref:Uncharacterized protein n=1 Tax=Emericellopsis atlantica TaxID=2614577 RepID=A0A9P7ZHX5_9HYPO|nr:uncharacterized protein F5Z01DRAFT_251779 [Emericellopsis atlantica]KAG9251808.1 hypothetical protein F5Z01DRAFT_251779 [Emericellopsis atlantica]